MSAINDLAVYLKGANEELRKVVWPTKNETVRATAVVIAMSIGLAIFFWVLDLIFSKVLSYILK